MRNSAVNIEIIIDAIRNSRVKVTEHADEEAANDDLSFEEFIFPPNTGKSSSITRKTCRIRVA